MDGLFLNRVLFERFRDRQKEQTHAKIPSLKEILKLYSEPIDFSKMGSCSFFTILCREFTRVKKRLSMQRLFRKTPQPLS